MTTPTRVAGVSRSVRAALQTLNGGCERVTELAREHTCVVRPACGLLASTPPSGEPEPTSRTACTKSHTPALLAGRPLALGAIELATRTTRATRTCSRSSARGASNAAQAPLYQKRRVVQRRQRSRLLARSPTPLAARALNVCMTGPADNSESTACGNGAAAPGTAARGVAGRSHRGGAAPARALGRRQ